MSVSSASFPYHAHSSNWNPVSRQDSELQSQSSGAAPGGDTTDDQYSTYRMDPRSHRQQHNRHDPFHQHQGHQHQSHRHHRHRQKEVGNKETSQQFIPRPKIPLEAGGPSQATNDPPKFAAELIKRLNHIVMKQSSDSKLKGILDLNKTRSSTYDQSYDLESDQSILDEHVDRVFNEDRRHNVSSMMDTSRMSNYHPGYRTLDTSARHQGFYGTFYTITQWNVSRGYVSL